MITALADRLTVLDALEIFIGAVITIFAGGWAVFAYLDLLQQPIRARLARGALPGEARRIGLAARLAAYVVSLSFISGTIVGAIVVEPRSSWGLIEIYALAFGITVLLLLISTPMILSFRGPVGRLIAGTRAVGAGDLEAEVAVTSSDELGELTASYDHMLAELRRTTEELRASRARIVAASDASRRAVERDLHDGAQQHLVLLNLKLNLARRELERGSGDPSATLSEADEDLDRALTELRDLAHGIYPQVLSSDGLTGALAVAAAQSAIPTAVHCDGAGRYRSELETAVYFCCLEALQNAVKHAGEGARATISLRENDGSLEFVVADDGAGYDAGSVTGSAGVQNMADRIGALGGELQIESAPGEGTRIRGKVPVES